MCVLICMAFVPQHPVTPLSSELALEPRAPGSLLTQSSHHSTTLFLQQGSRKHIQNEGLEKDKTKITCWLVPESGFRPTSGRQQYPGERGGFLEHSMSLMGVWRRDKPSKTYR